MKPPDYSNIIFDFGGVIVNIDVDRTLNAFRTQIPDGANGQLEKVVDSMLFKDFEKGLIDEESFRNELCDFLSISPEKFLKDQFENAWNALIVDIPAKRLELLENLSGNKRLFLLSNTNSIHMRYVENLTKEVHGVVGIDHLFEKSYYSHLVSMRKPDLEIYNFVITDSNLDTSDTIFLDDNPDNLAAAEKTGLATFLITPEMDITDIFTSND